MCGLVRTALLAMLGQLLLATALQARTMYVSDTFEIVVRSEKNETSGRNIMKLLPTGTPIEVLDMDDSWATVRLPEGRTGYTLKRYLISRLPYQLTAERLQEEVTGQKTRLATLTEQLKTLQDEHQRLQQASTGRDANLAEITQKYEQLRQDAAQYLQLHAEYTNLQQVHQQTQQRFTELNHDYALLKNSHNLVWFLSGAGVILTGWVIGILTERLRGRRRHQSGYSYQLPH
jgi:SH3 domain protein